MISRMLLWMITLERLKPSKAVSSEHFGIAGVWKENQAYRDRPAYQWPEPPGRILGKEIITQFATHYALRAASRAIAALPAPRSFPILNRLPAKEEEAILRTIRDILRGRRLSWLRRGHWGGVFRNREGLLGTGHRVYDVYRPHRAPRGPRRIIINDQGEWFYTPDHYRTFYWIPPK